MDLGRPDSALAYSRLALQIERQIGDRAGEGSSLGSIGVAHANLGRPDSALTYYQQALQISREVRNRIGEGQTLSNIGTVYDQALSRPDSALTYYQQALQIRRETEDRQGEGETLNNIGIVYDESLSRPDLAGAYYRQAVQIAREVDDRAGEGAGLHNLGTLYRNSAKGQDLRTAVAYYDSAAAVRATLATQTGGDANRVSYAELGTDLFEQWALAWLARRGEVGPQPSALAALAAGERGRSQALLDLLRASADRAGATPPGGATLPRVSTTPGADLVAQGRALVQAVSRTGSTALSYLVTRDTLITWLVLPSGTVEVVQQPISRDTLIALVAAFRDRLGADEAAARSRLALRTSQPLEAETQGRGLGLGINVAGSLEALGDRLSTLLLPSELRKRLPASGELVVVPHEALGLLPFAALPVGAAGERLGTRYALRYTPSLGTLAEVETGSGYVRSRGRQDALVVGNPAMPTVRTSTGAEDRLSPLPGAEEEGRWVAGRLGAALLRGAEATESAVRQRLPGASVVHLATHGYAYSTEARVRDSFVALAPGKEHDGLLTVGEVLDEVPQLTADLVVLSACQTGLGNLRQAEGTVGLQRAFLAKGARSVLVSLWSVSDEATAALMKAFYTHWLQDANTSKAEALRRAQEEVRSTKAFAHPRFWAAFQLVGAR